jgi:hypothetical protein
LPVDEVTAPHSIVNVATPSISVLESDAVIEGFSTSRSWNVMEEMSRVTSVPMDVVAGNVKVKRGEVSALREMVITRSAVIAFLRTPIALIPGPGW